MADAFPAKTIQRDETLSNHWIQPRFGYGSADVAPLSAELSVKDCFLFFFPYMKRLKGKEGDKSLY